MYLVAVVELIKVLVIDISGTEANLCALNQRN